MLVDCWRDAGEFVKYEPKRDVYFLNFFYIFHILGETRQLGTS